jgi:hypothetical protein
MTQNAEAAPLPDTVPGLLDAAMSIAGLDDFGDHHFMTGLGHLVDGLRNDARLSELGTQLAFGGIINQLVNKLRYIRDIKAHPEILEEKIVRPIIVLGLPRTGTTKLQRVLSAVPQTQAMTYWRLINPAPFADEVPGHPQGRIEAAKGAVDMLATHFPGFMARHPTEAMEPDEEVLLMQGSQECIVTWLFARVPGFYDYVMSCDQQPQYRFLYSQMQYLQWQDGGGRGRPWIMKSPCHTGVLDTVLKVFPDAVLVHCHRDVTTLLPSITALVEEMRKIHSDHVDRLVLGQEMLDYFGRSTDRNLTIRDHLPKDRILDVQYEEVLEDAVGVIRQVFKRIGRALSPDDIAAIEAHEKAKPKHYLGSYSYSASDYGLTAELIANRFSEYTRRYVRTREAAANV